MRPAFGSKAWGKIHFPGYTNLLSILSRHGEGAGHEPTLGIYTQ